MEFSEETIEMLAGIVPHFHAWQKHAASHSAAKSPASHAARAALFAAGPAAAACHER